MNTLEEERKRIITRLEYLGVIPTGLDNVRSHNIGDSDYAKKVIQPWSIWKEYDLNPWDADVVKRILRQKRSNSRKLDYQKIMHNCQERIRQIDNGEVCQQRLTPLIS